VLVMQYSDIFVGPDGSPGFTDLITHKIDTGDAKPIKQNYYRRSLKELEYVDAELEKMLASGVIRLSKSPWGAPVVLVRKKSGELRFRIDFRRLNEATKKDAYPLPKIDECLDALEGSRFFSTLDLASGYWQVVTFCAATHFYSHLPCCFRLFIFSFCFLCFSCFHLILLC